MGMPEDVRLCVTTYLGAKNISEQVYHFCLYQKASVYVCVFFFPLQFLFAVLGCDIGA